MNIDDFFDDIIVQNMTFTYSYYDPNTKEEHNQTFRLEGDNVSDLAYVLPLIATFLRATGFHFDRLVTLSEIDGRLVVHGERP